MKDSISHSISFDRPIMISSLFYWNLPISLQITINLGTFLLKWLSFSGLSITGKTSANQRVQRCLLGMLVLTPVASKRQLLKRECQKYKNEEIFHLGTNLRGKSREGKQVYHKLSGMVPNISEAPSLQRTANCRICDRCSSNKRQSTEQRASFSIFNHRATHRVRKQMNALLM